MTTLEKFLEENEISYYRITKLMCKNMGSFHRLKEKIQGKKGMEMEEYNRLIELLESHAKTKVPEKKYAVKTITVE